jgi:hypothetical protein
MLQYSDFINTMNESIGDKDDTINIYWYKNFEQIMNSDWSEIHTKRIGDNYKIIFMTNNKYYSVIIERGSDDDIYYLEEGTSSGILEKFKNKFKMEFLKNSAEYVKKFKYDPKCLGNLDYIRKGSKYNII